MRLLYSGMTDYVGEGGAPGRCWVRAWGGPGGPLVVVATEPPGHPGPGIGRAAATLATWCLHQFALDFGTGLDPAGLHYVEHFPSLGPGSPRPRSIYRLVRFLGWDPDAGRFGPPDRTPIARREVEGLAGAPLGTWGDDEGDSAADIDPPPPGGGGEG